MTDNSAKDRVKSDTDAALSVVDMEQKAELLNMTEQQQRERAIAQCHEVIGQIRGVGMIGKLATVASLVWLRDVKSQKIYNDIPGLGSWDKFCDYIGLSRRKVDEDLQNLKTFGEDFLATVASLRVGYRELRQLRQIANDGDVVFEPECVIIGDDRIPLTPDYSEDLQAAIESLLESKNRQLEDHTATIKAKDRILKDKEKLLNRQAKDLAMLEGRAETLGYTPGEEAIIQKLDNSRTVIDGFLMEFDPEKNPLPEDATPRMRATLMHTLDYFRRVITAAFDTAADIYGEPELDDDWVPPHLRKPLAEPSED